MKKFMQVFITATPQFAPRTEIVGKSFDGAGNEDEESEEASEKVLFHITLSLKIEIYRILKQKAKVSAIPAAPNRQSTFGLLKFLSGLVGNNLVGAWRIVAGSNIKDKDEEFSVSRRKVMCDKSSLAACLI